MAEEHDKHKVGDSSWTGRKRRGEKDSNSFGTFVAKSKTNNVGKEHLKRHHGGYGL